MKVKMDETTNFIKLYEHKQGKSEVPKSFHLWSAISLLAACVGNNVWFEKFKGKKLHPNLYIVLLGDSASGKGCAIDEALSYVEQEEIVGLFRGRVTSAYLHDLLSSARPVSGQMIRDSRVYLATPELSYSVGNGQLADDFVKFLTEMFTGGGANHREGTRSHREHKISKPCINWIGGSTQDWLLECISGTAISGGFFARSIIVRDRYDPKVRYPRPISPKDHDAVGEYLQARVEWLARTVRGQFKMTCDAEELNDHWYRTREYPTDERLAPTWKREDDIAIKLAMVMSMAELVPWAVDPKDHLIINRDHLIAAQTLLSSVRRGLSEIMDLATMVHTNAKMVKVVRDAIKEGKKVQRSVLLRRFQSRGITADMLDMLDRTLIASGEVELKAIGEGPRKSLWYLWKGRIMK